MHNASIIEEILSIIIRGRFQDISATTNMKSRTDLFRIPDNEHQYLNNAQGSCDKQYSLWYEYFLIVGLNFKMQHIQTPSTHIRYGQMI